MKERESDKLKARLAAANFKAPEAGDEDFLTIAFDINSHLLSAEIELEQILIVMPNDYLIEDDALNSVRKLVSDWQGSNAAVLEERDKLRRLLKEASASIVSHQLKEKELESRLRLWEADKADRLEADKREAGVDAADIKWGPTPPDKVSEKEALHIPVSGPIRIRGREIDSLDKHIGGGSGVDIVLDSAPVMVGDPSDSTVNWGASKEHKSDTLYYYDPDTGEYKVWRSDVAAIDFGLDKEENHLICPKHGDQGQNNLTVMWTEKDMPRSELRFCFHCYRDMLARYCCLLSNKGV